MENPETWVMFFEAAENVRMVIAVFFNEATCVQTANAVKAVGLVPPDAPIGCANVAIDVLDGRIVHGEPV